MPTRKPFSILIVALFLGMALAGCLGAGDDGPSEDDLQGAADDGNDQDWDTMPANRSGEFSAFREVNQTEEGVGGDPHTHDYWQGRTRVSLFERTAEMPPSSDPSGASVVFRPPLTDPASLVFEGTGEVEITISNPQRHACLPGYTLGGAFICTSNLDYHTGGFLPGETYVSDPRGLPSMEVEFLHAASDPDGWISAGTITEGEPFTITVDDPVWTDMPHARASLWAFRFTSNEPLDSTLVFDVAMDLVRDPSDTIPLWPGHPDFYADQSYRIVHQGSHTMSDGIGATGEQELVQPERLISYGTYTLHVFANITNVNPVGGGDWPTHVFLRFHNASFVTWNITDPFDDNYVTENMQHYWKIAVDPDGMDTPYASHSRWEFQVRGAFTSPVISCVGGGCMPGYQMDYDLTIIATPEQLPREEYNPTSRAS